MSNILTVAYHGEGSTDTRFLETIIQRTFEEIAFECDTDIDVYPVAHISSPGRKSIVENTVEIAKYAHARGLQVLCIHVDADAADNKAALEHRINPAFEAVEAEGDNICKNLVAIIPVHMSEAWMLADKNLLKEELGTTISNADLGIARQPESIANPKQAIENAIGIVNGLLPKKRRTLEIGAIYQPLGQNISLDELKRLDSYIDFRQSVIEAFKRLNYLHD